MASECRRNATESYIRIPGISQIHNIRCEEDRMRFWKAYGVGKGGWLISDQTLPVHIPKLQVAFVACTGSHSLTSISANTLIS